jgi:methionyl aminopeptidase
MSHYNLEKQRLAGAVAAKFFDELRKVIKPGVNLLEIEKLARQRISEQGMSAAFLGYKGYPAATCLSVNSAIVHGIPQDYKLRSGDVLSVDVGINNGGYLVDTAYTYGVGQVSAENRRLIETTRHALEIAIELCRPGNTTGDIGHAIQTTVENAGFSIVRELTGHGVGHTLQEEPTVPNYGRSGEGKRLEEGTVIAVEPITALKRVRVAVLADGWTIMADDDTPTAHFEHTVLITNSAPEVLTKPI